MNRTLAFMLSLLVGLSTFAAPAFGQTADVNRIWQDPTENDRPIDPLRGHITLGLGLDVFNHTGVRGGPADAGIALGSAGFGGRIADLERLGAYLYLGGQIDLFTRSDSDGVVRGRQRNPSPLDREDYSGLLAAELVSHPVAGVNELVSYRILLGTGAAYQEWNGSRALWTSSLRAEISYRFDGHAFGPFGSFDGLLQIGEVSSHTARGELRLGVRFVDVDSELFREGRVYLLLGGQSAKVNERKEQNLEEDSTLLGGGVLLRLRFVSLRAEAGVIPYLHFDEKDERGVHTRSSSRYGGSFFAGLSIGLQF